MADVGRGEHVDPVARLDALAHAPRSAELGAHGDAALKGEGRGHLGHRLAQAAGAIEHEAVVLGRCRRMQDRGQQTRQHTLCEVERHLRAPIVMTKRI
jgi:hypothetical protein